MDDLNPALSLLLCLRRAVECGESPRLGLQKAMETKTDLGDFTRRWLEKRDRGADHMILVKELSSPHRRLLFQVIERGMRGEPIHRLLLDMETEIIAACQQELDRHLALLPLKMLIPLLLMMFPALMILVLGPFLDALSSGLGS